MSKRDTIFALSSGRPPAAISVIRITGPNAHQAAGAIAGLLPPPRITSLRELRDPRSGEILDHGLVVCFEAPASSTGENVVELHCHGGRAVIDAILGALSGHEDLRVAEPGEFTRRAFENGKIDLTEAEGLADLIEAETEAQRKAAVSLAEGGLKRQIALWREGVVGLSAEAERAIDYDEEDAPPDAAFCNRCSALASDLRSWLDRPRIERLKDGVRIVVAGPPNAGKSSLLNVIAGEDRAIVTDSPGTTRDHIEVPLALAGLPVLLTDTAGLRESTDEAEALGVARAALLIESADVVIWLGDPELAPQKERVVKVHAKADLPGRDSVPAGSLAVSSLSGLGIQELMRGLEAFARTILPGDDALSLNRRQARHVEEAADALGRAAMSSEILLAAEDLRTARAAFDRLTGSTGIEDVLDALFARFCLGK
jgi:tRNA modification GTPase